MDKSHVKTINLLFIETIAELIDQSTKTIIWKIRRHLGFNNKTRSQMADFQQAAIERYWRNSEKQSENREEKIDKVW